MSVDFIMVILCLVVSLLITRKETFCFASCKWHQNVVLVFFSDEIYTVSFRGELE